MTTAEGVRKWADTATDSPLYHHLSLLIADTDELIRVINRIKNRPAPNMLFGAVQYLMATNPGSALSRFFPNFVDNPLALDEIDGFFIDFVLEHEEEIVEIGRTRYTQTNECRRGVALLAGIWEAPFDRFHLIDVGTSAGLNLAIDRYSYRWNDLTWGSGSSLEIAAESRGALPRVRDIEILSRIGLDLNPIDPGDPDQRLWLESAVWPEHHERRDRLRAALEVLRTVPVEFVAGDALRTLPEVFDRLPFDEPVVVMNSMVLIQWDPSDRERLDSLVATERSRRPVHRVSMEWFAGQRPDASELTVDSGEGWRHVGWVHHHGEWVELAEI